MPGLHLWIGPMYSSKTTTLLSRKIRYEIGGKKCLIIKYFDDKRYDSDDVISTHTLIKQKALSTDLLKKLNEKIINYDVIFIDEIQFFDDASEMCDIWANSKIVECFGLNGDFKREPFEQISKLIPLADNITHLTAIDKYNGEEASFTHRLTNQDTQKIIGGSEMYISLSRVTYNKFSN